MAQGDARKEVYTIIDRGQDQKGWWCRIGTAFENKDGSWNVVLDALPVNGTMNIRDPLPKDEADQNDRSRDSDRGGGSRGGGRNSEYRGGRR